MFSHCLHLKDSHLSLRCIMGACSRFQTNVRNRAAHNFLTLIHLYLYDIEKDF